jgi:hypothetical protein
MNIHHESVRDGIILLHWTWYCGWVTLERSFPVPNSMPSVWHWVKKLIQLLFWLALQVRQSAATDVIATTTPGARRINCPTIWSTIAPIMTPENTQCVAKSSSTLTLRLTEVRTKHFRGLREWQIITEHGNLRRRLQRHSIEGSLCQVFRDFMV